MKIYPFGVWDLVQFWHCLSKSECLYTLCLLGSVCLLQERSGFSLTDNDVGDFELVEFFFFFWCDILEHLSKAEEREKLTGEEKKTLKDQKKIVYTKNNCDMNIITATASWEVGEVKGIIVHFCIFGDLPLCVYCDAYGEKGMHGVLKTRKLDS